LAAELFLSPGGAYDLKPEWVDVNLTRLAQRDGEPMEIHTAQQDDIKKVWFLDDAGKPVIVATINWVD
jgi:hypothetical protein